MSGKNLPALPALPTLPQLPRASRQYVVMDPPAGIRPNRALPQELMPPPLIRQQCTQLKNP